MSSYKDTKPYRVVRSDRRSVAGVAGDVIATVEIEATVNGRRQTFRERGRSFCDALDNRKKLDLATENAKQDAIGRWIGTHAGGPTDMKSVKLSYNISDGKVKATGYGIHRVRVIKRVFRYRYPSNERVRRERWGGRSFIVRRRSDGTFINRTPVRKTNRSSYDLGKFSQDIDPDDRDALFDD